MEDADQIPVTLIEAEREVDSGVIYDQKWFDLAPGDLIDDWRRKLSKTSNSLIMDFVDRYPDSVNNARDQVGNPSFYPKRRPGDSQLDINQSIFQQFNKLRIVDNENYPAFFEINGSEFTIKIEKRGSKQS